MSPRPQAALALEYILLGFACRQPVHGYDLYKKLQSSDIGLVWRIKQGRLYALLDKLETLGLLSSGQVAGEGYPQRKEYRATAAGRSAFQAWQSGPVKHGRDMRQEFLARLYFAALDGPATVRALVTGQRRACQGWLEQLETGSRPPESAPSYRRLVKRFRALQIHAMLAWLDECEKELA